MKKKQSFYYFYGKKNLLKIMRLLFILMTMTSMTISANGFSQEQRVTLDVKNVGAMELFKQIQKETNLFFVYNDADLISFNKITVSAKDEAVDVLLNRVFTGLKFLFEGNVIIVKPTVTKDEKKEVKKFVIKGKVVDEKKQPLPGVTVRLDSTTVGCATDIDGKFSPPLPKELKDVVVVFRFVGMETQKVKLADIKDKEILAGKKDLKVVMEEQTENLEDVVVTGIFKRKKEGFTGSATQVSGEELKKMSSGNVLKALEMLDPGFKMNTSNMTGSNPNAIPDFQMRGQSSIGNYEGEDFVVMRGDYNTRPNQPLFVLDGIIGVDATTIMDLDPEQVESITLLKDAAATVMYGSEAANGVVVVETKAPKAGKLRCSYNGNYKLEWPDLSVYDLMDAKEKLEIEERAGYYDYKDDLGLQRYHNKIQQEVLRGVNTYWLSKPVQTAFAHRHGVNIEGGD